MQEAFYNHYWSIVNRYYYGTTTLNIRTPTVPVSTTPCPPRLSGRGGTANPRIQGPGWGRSEGWGRGNLTG